jgi:hypothetical protein
MGMIIESKSITMLKQILDELKSIKKQLKPSNELKKLKERLSQLEARVAVLEACNIHQSPITSPFKNPYQPPIMFDDVPPSSPLFPQVMGTSNTENISELSKEIDSSMPGTFKVDENNNVKVPSIAKKFNEE